MTLMSFYVTSVPARTKWAFTTRRVDRDDVAGVDPDVTQAVSGDLVLAQVTAIGQHKSIQLAEGRASQLYRGDTVVLTCGARYAPDQFEAAADIDPVSADMVAGGGVLGRMRLAHMRMARPTQVKPLGLLVDEQGTVINIGRYAIPTGAAPTDMTVIGVVGASMNAGKTTAAASLAHGLVRAGFTVGVIKATGTGAFGDYHAFVDAGAHAVADFTDAGMASTYGQNIGDIDGAFASLLAYVRGHGATVAVVELADGVFQAETEQLLRGSRFRDALNGLVFAAPDALGAVGGVEILRRMGLEPLVVAGLVSCSPLAVAEAEAASGVTVASRDDLCDPVYARDLLHKAGLAADGPVRGVDLRLRTAA